MQINALMTYIHLQYHVTNSVIDNSKPFATNHAQYTNKNNNIHKFKKIS